MAGFCLVDAADDLLTEIDASAPTSADPLVPVGGRVAQVRRHAGMDVLAKYGNAARRLASGVHTVREAGSLRLA